MTQNRTRTLGKWKVGRVGEETTETYGRKCMKPGEDGGGDGEEDDERVLVAWVVSKSVPRRPAVTKERQHTQPSCGGMTGGRSAHVGELRTGGGEWSICRTATAAARRPSNPAHGGAPPATTAVGPQCGVRSGTREWSIQTAARGSCGRRSAGVLGAPPFRKQFPFNFNRLVTNAALVLLSARKRCTGPYAFNLFGEWKPPPSHASMPWRWPWHRGDGHTGFPAGRERSWARSQAAFA